MMPVSRDAPGKAAGKLSSRGPGVGRAPAQEIPFDLARVLEDPATSDWLRYAAISLLSRDPLDALGDVEALLVLATAWAEAALAAAGEGAS